MYIFDRLNQNVSEEGNSAEMNGPKASTESKIHLKDDGLWKYKISPLGFIKDLKELVRIFKSAENFRLERNNMTNKINLFCFNIYSCLENFNHICITSMSANEE